MATKYHVPADVPDELIETFIDNMDAATCGTGKMNLFACDQKIEHLNDDFYDGGKKIPLSSNDPKHLFEIGAKAHAQGTIGVFAGQLGLISQYARDYPELPYLVKLNSKYIYNYYRKHLLQLKRQMTATRIFSLIQKMMGWILQIQ